MYCMCRTLPQYTCTKYRCAVQKHIPIIEFLSHGVFIISLTLPVLYLPPTQLQDIDPSGDLCSPLRCIFAFFSFLFRCSLHRPHQIEDSLTRGRGATWSFSCARPVFRLSVIFTAELFSHKVYRSAVLPSLSAFLVLLTLGSITEIDLILKPSLKLI